MDRHINPLEYRTLFSANLATLTADRAALQADSLATIVSLNHLNTTMHNDMVTLRRDVSLQTKNPGTFNAFKNRFNASLNSVLVDYNRAAKALGNGIATIFAVAEQLQTHPTSKLLQARMKADLIVTGKSTEAVVSKFSSNLTALQSVANKVYASLPAARIDDPTLQADAQVFVGDMTRALADLQNTLQTSGTATTTLFADLYSG